MVDYYRRSEKDGYRDSYGNVGHALERLYINKNNELASAIEKIIIVFLFFGNNNIYGIILQIYK